MTIKTVLCGGGSFLLPPCLDCCQEETPDSTGSLNQREKISMDTAIKDISVVQKTGKLSRKLSILVLFIFLSVVAGSVIYHFVSKQVIEDTRRIIKKNDRNNKLAEISARIAVLGVMGDELITKGDEQILEAVTAESNMLMNEINRYIETEQSEGYLHAKKNDEIKSMLKARENLNELMRFIWAAYERKDAAAMDAYHKKVMYYLIEIDKNFLEIKRVHDEYIAGFQSSLSHRLSNLMKLYLLLIIGGAVCIGVLRYLLKKFVEDPIAVLASATTRFAEGKLDERISITSDDELGMLARSFNTMAESIQERETRLATCCNDVEKLVECRTRELHDALNKLKSTQTELIESEKRSTVGQIAAGVTHTIRNPLNSISINLQLINKCLNVGKIDTEEMKNYVETLLGEVKRINHLVEEFVRSSRTPAPNMIKGNIMELLKASVDFVREEARAKGVSMILKSDGNIPDIYFDFGQMKDVFLNVIRNGIQAIKNGKGYVEISVSPIFEPGSQTKNHIAIHISDDGCGIRAEDMSKIFTPFFTTKSDGIGLGLVNSQQIVLAHGGNITCQSTAGSGTTFSIILPCE
ncbi:MAG: hypothetical protein A2073_08700 [Deltaproteobacteria bacterium GWC2_42_11]|nr:MAG: hypothetical protein A2073_08700 [Deltaproteobacteria bacterium GWC2_42_11]HBO84096.1 hypothetical protein [Deltaproteobacteria bacterium]